ncbi:enoyl-[acyl-carrier-protein] reductase FabK [Caldicellulosiruptoraceae bacterium PP1]
MIKSRICELIGIKYPIFQGGMAWVADAILASAVSNAGGLGIIAAGNAPADYVRNEIKKAKELTKNPIGVNIMLLSPYADEVAKIVIEEKVEVVTTGAGNPSKYINMWKENGIKVIPVIPSVALAKRVEKYGADAIIAEGGESGGHVGELNTMALIPQVVDNVSIPVIAAGGIADGRGIAAAFMLGAEGVQMGTRFLVSHECNIHRNYKDLVLKAKDTDTVVTGRFTGHPVRVLHNKLTRKMLQLEKEGCSIEQFEEIGKGSLQKAVKDGDLENGSFMAGQIAGLVNKEQTCKEIIDEVISEAEKIIKKQYERLYNLEVI